MLNCMFYVIFREQLNEGLKEDILRLRENNIKNAG